MDISKKYTSKDPIFTCIIVLLCLYGIKRLINSVIYVLENYPNAYQWTELFINYEGGFIRRGLLGEIIFQGSQFFDIRLIVFGIFIPCYVVFSCYLYKMLLSLYDKYIVLLILSSPGIFLLHIYDMAMLFRKDIFILLALMIQFNIISLYIKNKISTPLVYVIIFVVYSVSFLIHELTVFYSFLPGLLLFECAYRRGNSKSVAFLMGCILAISGAIIILNSGTEAQGDAIIASWKPFFTLNSKGAIGFIGFTISDAFQTVKSFARFPIMMSFFGALFLAGLPIGILFFTYNQWKSISSYFTYPFWKFFLAVAITSPFILNFIAIDYGRFISFNIIYYLIFIMTLQTCFPQQKSVYYQRVLRYLCTHIVTRYLVYSVICIYIFSWMMVHCSPDNLIRFSYPMTVIIKADSSRKCNTPGVEEEQGALGSVVTRLTPRGKCT